MGNRRRDILRLMKRNRKMRGIGSELDGITGRIIGKRKWKTEKKREKSKKNSDLEKKLTETKFH
jgi:hypothetical protein